MDDKARKKKERRQQRMRQRLAQQQAQQDGDEAPRTPERKAARKKGGKKKDAEPRPPDASDDEAAAVVAFLHAPLRAALKALTDGAAEAVGKDIAPEVENKLRDAVAALRTTCGLYDGALRVVVLPAVDPGLFATA